MSYSLIPIDQVVTFDAVTMDPGTGAVTDADSAPVYDVFEDSTDTPILSAQTMTKRTSKTGNYRGTFTASAANGFEAGKCYNVIASATVTNTSTSLATTSKKACLTFRCGPAETQAGVPKADSAYLAGQAITAAAGVTFPTSVASPTNITAGTITTVSGNVNGSVASVTGSVASVTGSVGSVTGAVGSVTGAVGSVTAAVAITSHIKKNQALPAFEFLMTDSTNHNPATGKTVTCTRSIDGGGFSGGTLANVTEVGQGMYSVDFGAGDLNGKVIVLRATASACDDAFERIVTQP